MWYSPRLLSAYKPGGRAGDPCEPPPIRPAKTGLPRLMSKPISPLQSQSPLASTGCQVLNGHFHTIISRTGSSQGWGARHARRDAQGSAPHRAGCHAECGQRHAGQSERIILTIRAPWLAVCRTSTLAATLRLSSRVRRQSRAKRGAVSRPTRAQRDQRQPTTNFDTLREKARPHG
jgi:hypothetical protein